MLSAQNQSNSSIDTSLNNDDSSSSVDRVARQLPPRLQHSPSLPNIRFPPHSAHHPPELSPTKTEEDDHVDRPKTPPPVDASNAPHIPRKSLQHRETQSIDDVASYLREQTHLPKKTHKRRATGKHDLGQALLTPPLTPSSSMKTTTSVDSATDGNNEPDVDTNSEATRFLYLGNISKSVPQDVLTAKIIDALLTGYTELSALGDLPYHGSSGKMEAFSERSVKGVFLRSQQTDGVVMLAFWDIRHAEIALRILSSPNQSPIATCLGDDDQNTANPWIHCRFVTVGELAKIAGSSNFLASTHGSFRIAFEDASDADSQDIGDNSVVDDRSDGEDLADRLQNVKLTGNEDRLSGSGEQSLDFALLVSFLHSFGDVRTCDLLDQKEPFDGKTFTIEYFNIIDAITAYRTIDGKDIFGAKIKVFGRNRSADEASLNSWESTTSNGPSNPAAISHSTVEGNTQVHAPGHVSQMRRSFYDGPHTPFRPGPVHSPGQERYTSPYIPSSTTPSPVVLYTTNPPGTDNSLPQMFPAGAQGVPSIQLHHPAEVLAPLNRGHHVLPHMPANGSPTPLYGDQDVEYPPSAYPQGYWYPHPPGTPDGVQHGYFPPPSPFPMVTDQASLAAMMSHHLPRAYGYYGGMSGQTTPVISVNGHHWVQTPPNAPHQAADQNWDSEVAQCAENTEAHMRSSSGAGRSPAPRTSPNRLHSATPLMRRSPLHPSRSTPSLVPPERNQLNLARIEDGQDTRTTVMIKNIPNKMTDKDLVAYIANVCPRRIDFLYLRMDFANGCNVGYAFVNFITVQDLLLFAREKLGEKWNMFSSEKVLQMSYANYQGKEALVEKFKNSCIMDEREAWRPKIFYSEPGPEQGLPEPFPAPTHLRRKERSSFNRGALYVPGVAGHNGRNESSTLYHGGGNRNGQGFREGRGDRHERYGGRRGKSDGDERRDIGDSGAFGSNHGRGKGRM